MIARDSTNLAWKTSHGNYVLTGIAYQSKLIGLFASVIKTHDHQWLLCDLLSIDGNESLEITLIAALSEANTHYLSLSEGQRNVNKVAILATPLMQPVLERIGFSKDKYTFHALIHLFDPNLTSDEVAPQHWYFSAND
jgi:hypothetical protein